MTLAGYVPAGSLLALSGRTVPNNGLARLRADGRLIEVGVDDLALGPPAGAPAPSWCRGQGHQGRGGRARRRDRGMAGRPVPRRAVPAGAAAVHPATDPVHRRRSLRRRLRPLRSPRAPLQRPAALPHPDLDPRSPQRVGVRRGHGAVRLRSHPRVDRAPEPPPGPARSSARVVPVPPSVPRRASGGARTARTRHDPGAASAGGGPFRGSRDARGRLHARARERRHEAGCRAAPTHGSRVLPEREERHAPSLARPARGGRGRRQRGARAHGGVDRGAERGSGGGRSLGVCGRPRPAHRPVVPRLAVAQIGGGDGARHDVARRSRGDVPGRAARGPGGAGEQSVPGLCPRVPRPRDVDPEETTRQPTPCSPRLRRSASGWAG